MQADFISMLVCPRDWGALVLTNGSHLECAEGHTYPIVEGIPVFLLAETAPTIGVAEMSLKRAYGEIEGDIRAPGLFLESLGVSNEEKETILELHRRGERGVDAVVQFLIAATCGTAYKAALGKLDNYPILAFPLSGGDGRVMVDVGCNWGRWSVAAAREGFRVVGCDPQLGAVVAAGRVARQLGVNAHYVCGDARWLPFPDASVDVTFSYSVLQHMGHEDCDRSVREMGRVLKAGGTALVQMANALGLRSSYTIATRGFRCGRGFEVRYRTPRALRSLFTSSIGLAEIRPDCYLGLGLQRSDQQLMGRMGALAVSASELLKRVSRRLPAIGQMADSVWVHAIKSGV